MYVCAGPLTVPIGFYGTCIVILDKVHQKFTPPVKILVYLLVLDGMRNVYLGSYNVEV